MMRAETFDKTGAIDVRALTKSFGQASVLRGIDLQVPMGSIVCLMGKSGGGKSTLLRCLNLLERPTSGRIEIARQTVFDDGDVLTPRQVVELRQQVGMIFQSFHLSPT
ncbi:MAG: amino acid ABC transporter ATP-binding protein [Alphaproteobacteria bacterium]|nr:amino acid ABC transporter ATP-binding protein [Alphaproteobacteria bacterium]